MAFPKWRLRELAGVLVLLTSAVAVKSQQPPISASALTARSDGTLSAWHSSVYVAGGFVPSYYIHTPALNYGLSLNFFNVGVIVGHTLGNPHGHSWLRGQPEAQLEVMPFWLAQYPKQVITVHYSQSSLQAQSMLGPYERFGASVTPLLIRWNFLASQDHKTMPWAQLGGGLLWTNHKFPIGSETSVINFTPQLGFGTSIFLKRRRSIDLGTKVVHISNAGLGLSNPGVNVSLQFTAGFSMWR